MESKAPARRSVDAEHENGKTVVRMDDGGVSKGELKQTATRAFRTPESVCELASSDADEIAKNPFVTVPEYTAEQWKDALRDLIQDPNAKIEILNISKWHVNEISVSKRSEP